MPMYRQSLWVLYLHSIYTQKGGNSQHKCKTLLLRILPWHNLQLYQIQQQRNLLIGIYKRMFKCIYQWGRFCDVISLITTESKLWANRFHKIWFCRLTDFGTVDDSVVSVDVVVVSSPRLPELSGSGNSSGMWRMFLTSVMQSFNVLTSFVDPSLDS